MALSIRSIRGNYDALKEIERQSTHQRTFSKLASRLVPASYEFTRAVFIHVVVFKFPHMNHAPLGRRLLQRDPNDYDVAFAQLKILQPQYDSTHKTEGLLLVKKLDTIRKDDDPALDFRVGYFYYLSWTKSKNQEEKRIAEARMSLAIKRSTSKAQIEAMSRVLNDLKLGRAPWDPKR